MEVWQCDKSNSLEYLFGFSENYIGKSLYKDERALTR